MSKEKNIDGLPEKYFTVPPGNDFDSEAYSILMEEIEFLNTLSTDLVDGCGITFENDYAVAQFGRLMESLLYQAKLIMKAGAK